MNKQMFFLLALLFLNSVSAQIEQKSDLLFKNQDPLKIKLSYSNKEIRLETDDTTRSSRWRFDAKLALWGKKQREMVSVEIRTHGLQILRARSRRLD